MICCTRKLRDGCDEVLPVFDSNTAEKVGQRWRSTAVTSIFPASASKRAATNKG
jgi:hypothetical protein